MLDLLEADPWEPLALGSFPVTSTSSRRRVVGLDVWIETRCDNPGPLSGRLVGAFVPLGTSSQNPIAEEQA